MAMPDFGGMDVAFGGGAPAAPPSGGGGGLYNAQPSGFDFGAPAAAGSGQSAGFGFGAAAAPVPADSMAAAQAEMNRFQQQQQPAPAAAAEETSMGKLGRFGKGKLGKMKEQVDRPKTLPLPNVLRTAGRRLMQAGCSAAGDGGQETRHRQDGASQGPGPHPPRQTKRPASATTHTLHAGGGAGVVRGSARSRGAGR